MDLIVAEDFNFLCLKINYGPGMVCANSKGFDQTAQKRRLVLALAGCICVKSHFCLSQKEKKSRKYFGLSEALAPVCSVLLNLLILSLLLVDKS